MDVEGTTTSISFVKDTLFPYARQRLPAFVRAHGLRPDVAALLQEARALAQQPALDDEGVIAVLLKWIDEDRKAPPLKALQGMLWEDGYRSGEYRGHVYPDVEPALRRWLQAGLRLFIYSSGSVKAQQLLFSHSVAGDLTPLLSGYFDTGVGAKSERQSYVNIAGRIGLAPPEILFPSDALAELEAAGAAGLQTVRLCREGTPGGAPTIRTVTSFDEILPS